MPHIRTARISWPGRRPGHCNGRRIARAALSPRLGRMPEPPRGAPLRCAMPARLSFKRRADYGPRCYWPSRGLVKWGPGLTTVLVDRAWVLPFTRQHTDALVGLAQRLGQTREQADAAAPHTRLLDFVGSSADDTDRLKVHLLQGELGHLPRR